MYQHRNKRIESHKSTLLGVKCLARNKMNIYENNIPIKYLKEEEILVSLKWLRGANRYNNGATRYGNKYSIRLFLNWAQDKKKSFKKKSIE